MKPNLQIKRELFKKIVRCARRFAPDECMGLLARRSRDRSGRVTAGCLLPAVATPGKAEAAPLDISAAVARLAHRGLVPVGIWHSHGEGGVHHSQQDDTTIACILPAMALENYRRPGTGSPVPCVTGPDEAELPLPDGTALHFNLLGPPLPGCDARERMAWSIDHDTVPLTRAGSPVCHGDHFPASCGRAGRFEPRTSPGLHLGEPGRRPRGDAVGALYSLVVNAAGGAYALALTIHDIGGEPLIQQGPCPIETFHERDVRSARPGRAKTVVPARSKRARRSEDLVLPGDCDIPKAEDEHECV